MNLVELNSPRRLRAVGIEKWCGGDERERRVMAAEVRDREGHGHGHISCCGFVREREGKRAKRDDKNSKALSTVTVLPLPLLKLLKSF